MDIWLCLYISRSRTPLNYGTAAAAAAVAIVLVYKSAPRDQTLQQQTVQANTTMYDILRCDYSVLLIGLTTLGRVNATFRQPSFNSTGENKAFYVYVRSRTPRNYCTAADVVLVFQCACSDQTLQQQ